MVWMWRHSDVDAVVYPWSLSVKKSLEAKLEWSKLLLQLQVSQINIFELLHTNFG